MYNSHLTNATQTEFRIYGIALPVLSIVSVFCNIFVFAVLLRDFETNWPASLKLSQSFK